MVTSETAPPIEPGACLPLIAAPAAKPIKPGDFQRIPVLDGIRGIAIVLTILGHALWSTKFHLLAMEAGGTGVSIFFVLSGYLITRILLNEERKAGFVDLQRFYKRRAWRIFPAFYVFLGVAGALSYTRVFPQAGLSTWLASCFYVRNFFGGGWETGHLWTLALEEQFYLFWPALFVVSGRRYRKGITLAAIALLGLWRMWVLASGHYSGGLYSRPDLRMDTFLIGAVFALFGRSFINRRSALPFTALLTVWSIIGPGLTTVFETSISALLIGGLIAWLATEGQTQSMNWLAGAVPSFLGTVSYSLYLWQQLFLGPHLRWWSLPALLATACWSYFLIEQPALRLRARLT